MSGYSVINEAKIHFGSELALNHILAGKGGYADSPVCRHPWFRMVWAATDFVKDIAVGDNTPKEFPRCFHERQDCYHILKFNPEASAFGGDYICTGIHLLDTSTCKPHRNNASEIMGEGETCTCKPVNPTRTIAELIVPMIEQNQVIDKQARRQAIAAITARRNVKKEEYFDNLIEPLRPTFSGRMPEFDHPASKRLLEET